MSLEHDVVLITKDNYPTIFKAFELISHDRGSGAGHINYTVPASYSEDLGFIEYNLKSILENADDDFTCLCIGDIDEAAKIVEAYKIHITDKFLTAFFEEFQ